MAGYGWSGFSDEELKRLKHSSEQIKSPQIGENANVTASKMARKFQYNPPRGGSRSSRAPPSSQPVDPAAKLSSSEMLSRKPQIRSPDKLNQEPPGEKTSQQNGKRMVKPGSDGDGHGKISADKGHEDNKTVMEQKTRTAETDKNISEDVEKDVKVLDEKEIMSMELANIANFQKQQKAMEELNKQKKLQLMRALEDRRKKAKAEANKLTDVQKELAHLDSLLTAEVSILRDKIEDASLHFMEAQKRYEKAEKEFVESKLDLHHKSDLKEQLTGHLYTIIYQNEVRKAKKLAELMEKLEMECSAEDLAVALPPLPHTSMMNSVQTLGPSGPLSPTHARPLNQSNQDASQTTQYSSPLMSQPTSLQNNYEPQNSGIDISANKSVDVSKDKTNTTAGSGSVDKSLSSVDKSLSSVDKFSKLSTEKADLSVDDQQLTSTDGKPSTTNTSSINLDSSLVQSPSEFNSSGKNIIDMNSAKDGGKMLESQRDMSSDRTGGKISADESHTKKSDLISDDPSEQDKKEANPVC